jgi:hypothetical protein
VKPELTLALTHAAGAVRVSGTVNPAKGRIMLEVRAAGGSQRVVQRQATEAQGGAFADTITLPPGRYWVTAGTQADATNVAGESPQVAANI